MFSFVIMGLIAGGFALLGLVSGVVLGGEVGAVVGLLIGLVVGETIYLAAACVLGHGWWTSPPRTEPVNDHSPS